MKGIKFFKMMVLACGTMSMMLVGCSNQNVEAESIAIYGEKINEDEIIVENDMLAFHFDTRTTQFYIVKKSTGEIWHSNPQDADEDPKADTGSKDLLKSPISLTYSASNGMTTTLSSYKDSIKNETYTYEKLPDGVKVNYSIGNIAKQRVIPTVLPESRMKVYYDQLERSEQKQLEQVYRILDINKLSATDNKEELLAKYPELETERIYEMREKTQEYMLEKAEEIFVKAGYTYEDFEDDQALYANEKKNDKPIFNVSIVYQIDEKGLVVSVPMEDIEYKASYPITELKILPYLGAGGTSDEGFMIVPDGGGGLIHFNNGKNTQSSYINTVYGPDYGLKRAALIDENRAVFPVFGVSKGDNSFIGVIEEGSSYAVVEADVSGRLNSYNNVCSKFTMIHGEDLDVSAKSNQSIKVFEPRLPEEEIKVRYYFLDSSDYVSMATKYREHLLEENAGLAKQEEASSLPVVVEYIGAIDRVKQRFGIPTTVDEPLTSYNQVVDMTKQLQEAGFENLTVKYNGWFNQGVVHKVPDQIKLMSDLGTKKEFSAMVDFMEQSDIDFYVEANFTNINKNELGDSFYTNRDAAKFISKELVKVYPYSSIWYGQLKNKSPYYLAKPGYYCELIENFMTEAEKLGLNNIAFGGTGRYLSGDYNEKSGTSREQTMHIQEQMLEGLNEQNKKLMVYAGNAYTLPYTDFIVDMKLDTKGFNIIDEEIPFYQIAIHGLVPYAGEAVNLAEDYTKNILKSVETGAGLYFVFIGEENAKLQDSNYTKYFAVDFSRWSKQSQELYTRMKDELGHVYNQYIVTHEKISDGVYKTQYEDGTTVVVNYNKQDIIYDGLTVPAEDYRVKGGR